MLFKYDNLAWHGNIIGECVHNGVTIRSRCICMETNCIVLTKHTREVKMVWGSNNIYKFVRTENDFLVLKIAEKKSRQI